jgi:hypothetical protein
MASTAPLEHCPKCNGLMPPEESRCIRCGFELPPQTKHEIKDSSDSSHAPIGNAASTQLSWGAIWALIGKERKSNRWRIFPVACLAWFAYLVFPIPINWSDGVGLSFIAFLSLMMALPTTYLLNLIWSIGKAIVAKKESEGGWPAAARSARRINWTKVFAVVLTSNVFFLTSCTGGFLASYVAFEKMGGRYMDQGEKPSESMVVIAAVPNPTNQGPAQFEQVRLQNLDKFKAANPTYSFLIPLGSGKITIHSEAYVTYEVQPLGEGKVLVETKYHQTMGGLVIARYEATDKSVRPIFTNDVQWMAAFFLGALLAIILNLIGGVLRYFVTASDRRRSLAQTT